jgi:hypothetical protein
MGYKNSYGWAAPVKQMARGGGVGGAGDPSYQLGQQNPAYALGSAASAVYQPRGGVPDAWSQQMAAASASAAASAASGETSRMASSAANPTNPTKMTDPYLGYGMSDVSKYGDEGFGNMMERYTNYYAVPKGNLDLANRTQDYNQISSDRAFIEQQKLNEQQNLLANKGSNREDLSLNFAMDTNKRDFGESQRLADRQYGLDDRGMATQEGNLALQGELGRGNLALQGELGRGNLNATNYGNETERLTAMGQLDLGKGNLALGHVNANNQYDIGLKGATNDANRIANELSLGRGNLTNDATRIANEMTLGTGNLALQGELGRGNLANDSRRVGNEGRQIDNNYNIANRDLALQDKLGTGQLGATNFANDTARLTANNQMTLGQGQLSYQDRALSTDDAYKRAALAQEDALTKQKLQNDMTQSRYAAFGRASAPNARAARSWY